MAFAQPPEVLVSSRCEHPLSALASLPSALRCHAVTKPFLLASSPRVEPNKVSARGESRTSALQEELVSERQNNDVRLPSAQK